MKNSTKQAEIRKKTKERYKHCLTHSTSSRSLSSVTAPSITNVGGLTSASQRLGATVWDASEVATYGAPRAKPVTVRTKRMKKKGSRRKKRRDAEWKKKRREKRAVYS